LPPAYRRRQSSLHERCAPFARIAIPFLGLIPARVRSGRRAPSHRLLLSRSTRGRAAASSASGSQTDSLSYHPAANPMDRQNETSTEPRLPWFCLSAPLIRPCLRDFSFWPDAVGRLLLRKLLPTPSRSQLRCGRRW
jgi:hypothetical protein